MTAIEVWIDSSEGRMIVTIIGALMTGTLLAWLTQYYGQRGKFVATKKDFDDLKKQLQENTDLTKSIEKKYLKEHILWKSELDFRERQLSELYGPAYGIIKSEKEIFDLWINGQMQDVNLQVKKLFDEHNKFLMNLIIHKSHLIDGATMPACFVRYNTNSIVWGLYAASTEEGVIPPDLAKDPRVGYPSEFDTHIIETTERLKARIEALHKKYAEPLLP